VIVYLAVFIGVECVEHNLYDVIASEAGDLRLAAQLLIEIAALRSTTAPALFYYLLPCRHRNDELNI
jgi:hypothetical protein